jgi:hypothetical protein
MGSVRNVGRGFFPLDEELKLLCGELTPFGHECLVRLSSWMPFEKAAELMGDMLGIRVTAAMGQRYSEAAGAAYEEIQQAEVTELEREMSPGQACAEKLQISADGAMVPLLHGVWAEVKTLVIGEVQAPVEEQGEMVVHTRHLSYFSRKVNAEEFQRLSLVEMHRRGVLRAKQVAAVMDGAEWEQNFTDYHCPHAARILDFAHAAEHISPIGEFLHGQNTPETKHWLERHLHQLKHHGPSRLLGEFRKLQTEHPQATEISGNLAYLEKRKLQLQYPLFQQQGWPIGSGIVESGNKLVVEARLKGAGMHWAEAHVNPMLTLRNILCSDRWKTEWPKIEYRLRQQNDHQRARLHQSRKQIVPTPRVPAVPLPEYLPLLVEPPLQIAKPKLNPWRNFKHGKALFQRPDSPKI